ncbi:MAG: hypothetical protein WCG80_07935 [Spirochaetales bacterium]
MRNLQPKRVYFLIRSRFVSDFIPILLGAAILVGLNVLGWVFTMLLSGGAASSMGQRDNYGWPGLVVLACFLTSARAFHAMQSPKSTTDWLLLPATSGEKYLAALLQTQVIVPVVTSLVGLLLWVFTNRVELPVEFGVWQMWGLFVVMNLLLFTGSAVFGKFALLKTFASLVGFAAALALLGSLGLKLFGVLGPGSNVFVGMENVGPDGTSAADWQFRSFNGSFQQGLQWFWHFGIFVFTPVCALLFGSFRVAEKEARHAVQ